MTVTSIRFHPSSLLGSTLGHEKKDGLLPTPTNRDLSSKGVVCVDRAVVDSGKLTVLVPKLVRVRNHLIRANFKNSFLEFEVADGHCNRRRMSCPDAAVVNTDGAITRDQPVVTTYMIRNIPTRFTSLSFVRLLEEYGFGGTFNFFYLPMDFRSGKNMGYGFINFQDPASGTQFVEKFNLKRLPVTTSKKVMEISPSRRQGFYENIALFRTSDLLNSASLPHYKPLIATIETGGALVPLTEYNFPPQANVVY